jgi:Xaa-Pro aminopeptidase
MPFLSNFKGSNGQMLVTKDQALLWTDGRYWLAAEKCLPEFWTLMKMGTSDPTWFAWAVANLPSGSVIGYDPNITPADAAKTRGKFFTDNGLTFKPIPENLVHKIWSDRPSYPLGQVIVHPQEFAGTSVTDKVG